MAAIFSADSQLSSKEGKCSQRINTSRDRPEHFWSPKLTLVVPTTHHLQLMQVAISMVLLLAAMLF